MKMTEIRSIAQDKGIKTGKHSKIVLIHAIQRTEGNFDCFGTAINGQCDQTGCQWHEDCLGKTQH